VYNTDHVVLTQVTSVTDRWRNDNIAKQAVPWARQTLRDHGLK